MRNIHQFLKLVVVLRKLRRSLLNLSLVPFLTTLHQGGCSHYLIILVSCGTFIIHTRRLLVLFIVQGRRLGSNFCKTHAAVIFNQGGRSYE